MKPRALTLPSGRRVHLREGTPSTEEATEPEGLFSGARDVLADGTIVLTGDDGAPLDMNDLALGDFHVIRAVLTKDGVLEEPEIEITCRNCEAKIAVTPCAGLEIAPWEDGDLGDEELDTTLPFGEPIEIPTIPLGRVRSASTVTFAARTVKQATPLFVAFEQGIPAITPAIVEAMGITALGNETNAEKIADALSTCEDDAFDAITDAFLASHYVLRLGSAVQCTECRARNDVDAPSDREMDPVGPRPHAGATDDEAEGKAFPTLEEFVARVNDLGAPMLDATPGGGDIELVVDDGTPAVDDGGEPLLGGYEPPVIDGFGGTTRPPTITLYFRTFLAMWNDEGPYDWEDEVHETIEHELEHHVYFLDGADPMDEAEHAAIDDEARRLVGSKEAKRRVVKSFGASLGDFVKRAWPLLVIAFVALLLTLWTQSQ